MTAGLVIVTMSVTGVLLAFERQIVAFGERNLRATSAEASAAPLPLSRVVGAAMASAPGAKPSNVIVRSDRLAPVTVAFGRERTLFVNRYTGEVLGEGAKRLRAFFAANQNLHRWLAMKGEGRERGKAITGAANLAFLCIVLSGSVLWWPRRFNRTAFRNVLWFRRGLTGPTRDFNWHNVFGIWAFLPLVAIVFSGVVISYPWASRLVYRAFGSTPPKQQQQQPEGQRARAAIDLAALDSLWAVAQGEAARAVPDWKSLSLRLPISRTDPVTFAVDRGNGTRPDKRSQLVIDPRTHRLVEHKTYAKQEAGQQARSWLRWIHTGEAGALVVCSAFSTRLAVAQTATGNAGSGAGATTQLPLRQFDIAAGTLADTLRAYEAASGTKVRVEFDRAMLDSMRSPGVRGLFSNAEALAQLLSESGIQHRFTGTRQAVLTLPSQRGHRRLRARAGDRLREIHAAVARHAAHHVGASR